MIALLLGLVLQISLLSAVSLSEVSSYPQVCQEAAENNEVFFHFKRNPDYTAIVEHVSYEQGLAYLKIIREEYPDLLDSFYRFRQNDLFGDPVTFDYGEFGWFSPTTLRYIKVAGDLRKEFGDLGSMHIVEIGGGYGGQCKILADLGGFASYTLIDLPPCNALSRKYLKRLGVQNVHFIDSTQLDLVREYDLVISNYAFSELDRAEQIQYLQKVIHPTPRGYMTCNFITFYLDSLSIEELIRALYVSNKKGCVEAENPLTGLDNLLVTWRQVGESRPSILKGENFLSPYPKGRRQSAVTYEIPQSRLGDLLLPYFHAKWIARQYGLPFLYQPFTYSDFFHLSEMDQPRGLFRFRNHIVISKKEELSNVPPSTLITIPYFPESRLEYEAGSFFHAPYFQVDWDDPEFRKEVVECLRPKSAIDVPQLPQNSLTVAVHVRRGGQFDDYSSASKTWPLKFPPDSYYIEQIRRIAQIFKERRLVVYIFTDDSNPKAIAESYAAAVQNPNICFTWGWGDQSGGVAQMFQDFYFMGKFDCLIRCMSNFSVIASLLGDYALMITPSHYGMKNNQMIIDKVEIKFKTKRYN